MVGNVTGTGFSLSSSIPALSIIPAILHTHRHLHVLTTTTIWQNLGTSQNATLFQNRATLTERYVPFFYSEIVALCSETHTKHIKRL